MLKKVSKIVSSAVLISLAFVASGGGIASAFSTTYFYDAGDSTNGGNTTLVAGHTMYVDDARAHVRAYFAPKPDGSAPHAEVGIQGADYCPGGNWDNGPSKLTGNVTKFQIGSITRYGVYKSGSCDATKDTKNWEFSFESMPWTTIGDTKLYYVDIMATNQASKSLYLQNGFRVYQPTTSSNNQRKFVAQVGGTSGNEVTVQNAPMDGKYRDYVFRFGAGCDVPAAGKLVPVTFYDLDNVGDKSGAQPSGGPEITLSITTTDKNGNVLGKVPLYSRTNNGGRQSLFAANTYSTVPNNGSSQTIAFYFYAYPNTRYAARLTNVYANNTIQFSTPYDGVYFEYPECSTTTPPPGGGTPKNWFTTGATGSARGGGTVDTVRDRAGFTRQIPVGQSMNWWHQIDKTGEGSASRGTITAHVMRYEIGVPGERDIIPGGSPVNAFGAGTIPHVWYTGSHYDTTANDVGKTICERLSWAPTYSTNGTTGGAGNTAQDGKAFCYTVVANPAVHILGNDVRVGSGFSSTTNNGAKIKGAPLTTGASYGEYGVFAPGAITNFASQGGGSGGFDNPSPSAYGLTFSNTAAPNSLGNYARNTDLGTIPDVAGSLSTIQSSGSVTVEDDGTRTTVSGKTTNVKIIKAGTINITDDLTYDAGSVTGDATSAQVKLPQLILIADQINISAGVKNVNAWLIANGPIGSVDTCAYQSDLKTNCKTPLTINGPIMAKTLKLKRTFYEYGKPDSASKAAETINMRGDAYVVSEQLAQQQSSWQTVYTTDLPPRY